MQFRLMHRLFKNKGVLNTDSHLVVKIVSGTLHSKCATIADLKYNTVDHMFNHPLK